VELHPRGEDGALAAGQPQNELQMITTIMNLVMHPRLTVRKELRVRNLAVVVDVVEVVDEDAVLEHVVEELKPSQHLKDLSTTRAVWRRVVRVKQKLCHVPLLLSLVAPAEIVDRVLIMLRLRVLVMY
jgi:hypothetical protein